MYIMNDIINKCLECDKIYSCYNSLWTHNKKYHNIKNGNKESRNYECRICKKEYKHFQSRYTHEKTCKYIPLTRLELDVERTKLERTKIEQENLDKEQETEKIKQETLNKEQELIKLKIKLQGMKKINNKTFKSINKFLMDRSTINTQNIINNNNTINNHYHLQIMALGNENVLDILSRRDKRLIMDSRMCSLEKMVEIVHCGSHNMFKNIIITNLKDKFAYKYDEKKGYFITTTKKDVLDDLVANRMMDIEAIYDELSSANKIDVKTKEVIQKFLTKMDNEEPYMDTDETIVYPNFKSYKMNNIKIFLYNNQDKITKDIALLIGDDI